MGLWAIGCAAPLAEYQNGSTLVIRQVPRPAMVMLYADGIRVESTTVQVGDEVGFARHRATVVAICGQDQILLGEGHYAWFVDEGRFHPPAASSEPIPGPTRDLKGSAALGYAAIGLIAKALEAVRRVCDAI